MDYSVSTPPSPAHRTPLSTCSTPGHVPALPIASGVGHVPPAPAKSCHTTCPGGTRSLPQDAPKDGLRPWATHPLLWPLLFLLPGTMRPGRVLRSYFEAILRSNKSRGACTICMTSSILHRSALCSMERASCLLRCMSGAFGHDDKPTAPCLQPEVFTLLLLGRAGVATGLLPTATTCQG